jgi:RHS repeat-associated protein
VHALSVGALFGGLGRITQQTSADGTSDYSHDATSQLTGADHDYQADETYSYDSNGNRTMSGYSTGDNNQLLSDGTYSYEYDDEGNRTLRTNDTTDETTEYEWDYRNRLTKVTDKDTEGQTTQVVAHTYDLFNRRISRAVDTTSPFDLADAAIERYILDDASGVASLDGGNVILDFVDPDGPEGTAELELARRYLYGPAVDQLLAQENIAESLGSDDRVYWPLGDHLQTTRDLVEQSGSVAEHYQFDSYGQVTSGDTSLTRYLFTAREFDEATGLQYNRARWYDAVVGKWISEDPLRFVSGDSHLDRYIGNSLAHFGDPTGWFTSDWHRWATEDGLSNTGLRNEAIFRIAGYNVNQDSGWPFNSGAFGDPINHGTDVPIEDTIRRIEAWYAEARNSSDPNDVLAIFGKILHATQDLYAHTNYVETCARDRKMAPVWQFTGSGNSGKVVPIVPQGVITSTYKWPLDNAPPVKDTRPSPSRSGGLPVQRWTGKYGLLPHSELNKDDRDSRAGCKRNERGVTYFDLAIEVASVHTTLAWRRLANEMSPEMKAKFVSLGYHNGKWDDDKPR